MSHFVFTIFKIFWSKNTFKINKLFFKTESSKLGTFPFCCSQPTPCTCGLSNTLRRTSRNRIYISSYCIEPLYEKLMWEEMKIILLLFARHLLYCCDYFGLDWLNTCTEQGDSPFNTRHFLSICNFAYRFRLHCAWMNVVVYECFKHRLTGRNRNSGEDFALKTG